MSRLGDTLNRAVAAPRALSADDCAYLLSLSDPEERRALHAAAYAVKMRAVGPHVSVRGLVEAGNICSKDCYYCGIRKSNAACSRYTLSEDEIVETAKRALALGYGNVVIQSGEIASAAHTEKIASAVRRIVAATSELVGVTLSCGEQEEATYRVWREAGARRYLLRIETSDPAFYARLHPADHSFDRRVACLGALKRLGYLLGTGVMCALPGQTPEMLARDVGFFAAVSADMIGMGPYIPHPGTPLAADPRATAPTAADRLRLGLDLIAVTRLYLHDVNIAASTALQALAPDGRAQGLRAGANVIMPNVTAPAYKRRYDLYQGKRGLDADESVAREALLADAAAADEDILFNRLGDRVEMIRP